MAILAVGAEDIDFDVIPSGIEWLSNNNSPDPSFEDEAFSVPSTTEYVQVTAPASAAVMWFHALAKHNSFGNFGSITSPILSVVDTAGQEIAKAYLSGNNVVSFAYWDGAAFVSVGATSFDDNNAIPVDICIDTVTGHVTFVISGVVVAEADVALVNQGKSLRLLCGTTNASSTYTSDHAEIIIADETTVGMRLKTLRPGAAGFHVDWSGTFSNIADPSPASSTGAISSSTVGGTSTFKAPAWALPAGFEVAAIVVSSAAMAGATGPQSLAHAVRVGSTVQEGVAIPLAQTYEKQRTVFNQNPISVAPWGQLDFSTFEFGVVARP